MQEDKALVGEMLRLFMEVAPERLEKLETAAARGDAETLAEEAKRIGAAAEHIASTSLGQLRPEHRRRGGARGLRRGQSGRGGSAAGDPVAGSADDLIHSQV